MTSDMAALASHLDADQRLLRMPAKRSVQMAALRWLASRLQDSSGRWTEREVTERIAALIAFDDPVRMRRDLVDCGLLCRETGGNAYWLPTDHGQSDLRTDSPH